MSIKDTSMVMTPFEAFYSTSSTHVVNEVTNLHFLSPTTIVNNIQQQWTMCKHFVVHVQRATGRFNYFTADRDLQWCSKKETMHWKRQMVDSPSKLLKTTMHL